MKDLGKKIAIVLACAGSLTFWLGAPSWSERGLNQYLPMLSSQGYIAEIAAVSDRPMITVRPASETKQPVLLHWRADENRWFWTWPSGPGWSPTPDAFFERNGEWWIERHAPKFGRSKETLGFFAQSNSWSFSAGRWHGTTPPPTIDAPQP